MKKLYTPRLNLESAITNNRMINSAAALSYLIFGTLASLICMGDFNNTGNLVIALSVISVPYGLSLLIKLPEQRMPFRFGGKWALYYGQLFALLVFASGLFAALYVAQKLKPLLTVRWLDIPLESLVDPVSAFICLIAGVLVTGSLLRFSRFPRDSVLAGRLDSTDALDILRLGACWLWYVVFLLIYTVIRDYPYSLDDLPLVDANPCVFVTAWGSILGYALPYSLASTYRSRLQLGIAASRTAEPVSCWLVFNAPVTNTAKLKLIDRLAPHCKNGLFTLVAPAGSTTFGPHLFWANAANRLNLLFPSRRIEIPDWRRVTPSAGIGFGLPKREIYPISALVPETVATLRAAQDLVFLVFDSFKRMEHWRGLLPVNQTFVLMDVDKRFYESDEGYPREIAGYWTVHPDEIKDLAELPSRGIGADFNDFKNTANDLTNAGYHLQTKANSSFSNENKTALGDFILEQIKADFTQTEIAQTFFRHRKKLMAAGLLLVLAAGYWLAKGQCFYYDPPFECKFNQRE